MCEFACVCVCVCFYGFVFESLFLCVCGLGFVGYPPNFSVSHWLPFSAARKRGNPTTLCEVPVPASNTFELQPLVTSVKPYTAQFELSTAPRSEGCPSFGWVGRKNKRNPIIILGVPLV